MDRFARLCWYWQKENENLRKTVSNYVRFEDLITDFDYFRLKLLDPIGVSLAEEQWSSAVRSPMNTTPRHSLPRWFHWDAAMSETFERICGHEMQMYGYKV